MESCSQPATLNHDAIYSGAATEGLLVGTFLSPAREVILTRQGELITIDPRRVVAMGTLSRFRWHLELIRVVGW